MAYKVFDVSLDGDLWFQYNTHKDDWKVQMGIWMKADKEFWKEDYPYGFHVFLTEEAATAWMNLVPLDEQWVVRVRVRRVVASGDQDDNKHLRLPTLVAREMYVPNPRKRKKK
ncbi:MAG: hypothetical protein KGL39_58550 [Patescibacteria group bacterium]|nr:hypothetical protein [Patescibacteria group bacterium]